MRLVLLGDPVAHSLSPVVHDAALRAVGVSGSYEARRVDAAGLVRAIEDIRRGVLAGANVTMPHKQRAADLCDQLSPEAARAGAVNTLVCRDGVVEGLLTDVDGVASAWGRGGLSEDAPVLVLGAGGAAAAALLALEGRALSVSARRAEAARSLVDRLGIAAAHEPWGEAGGGSVVVNATPIGMEGEALPIPLATAVGLFDMAYGPAPTPAVIEASDNGLAVVSGHDMLLAQAAFSFAAWTGRPAPEAVMRKALTSSV